MPHGKNWTSCWPWMPSERHRSAILGKKSGHDAGLVVGRICSPDFLVGNNNRLSLIKHFPVLSYAIM